MGKKLTILMRFPKCCGRFKDMEEIMLLLVSCEGTGVMLNRSVMKQYMTGWVFFRHGKLVVEVWSGLIMGA